MDESEKYQIQQELLRLQAEEQQMQQSQAVSDSGNSTFETIIDSIDAALDFPEVLDFVGDVVNGAADAVKGLLQGSPSDTDATDVPQASSEPAGQASSGALQPPVDAPEPATHAARAAVEHTEADSTIAGSTEQTAAPITEHAEAAVHLPSGITESGASLADAAGQSAQTLAEQAEAVSSIAEAASGIAETASAASEAMDIVSGIGDILGGLGNL